MQRIRYETEAVLDALDAIRFLKRKDSISEANVALMTATMGASMAERLQQEIVTNHVRVPGSFTLAKGIVNLDIACMLYRRELNHASATRWRYLHADASPQAHVEVYGFIEFMIRNPEGQAQRPFVIEKHRSPIATLPHGFQSVHDKAMRTLKLMHRETGPTEAELRVASDEVATCYLFYVCS